MILPLPGPAPHLNGPNQRVVDVPTLVYELRAADPLPSIDCARSIKRALLRGAALKRYNACQRATARLITLCFTVGAVFASAACFFDKRVNQWAMPVAAALLVPAMLLAYMMLRVDMAKLLLTTYEFWYFTTVQLLSNAMVCLNIRDQRALLILALTIVFEYVLIIDASIRNVRIVVAASVFGAVALATFVFVQAFGLIRDYDNVQLAAYGQWTLRATDVTVNGLSSVVLVMLRNAYRKRLTEVSLDQDHAVVRCISYRARIKFVEVERTVSNRLPTVGVMQPASKASSRSQLRLTRLGLRIHVADYYAKTWLPLPALPTLAARCMWDALGFAGVVASCMAVAIPGTTGLAVLGFVCTTIFTGRCVAYHNRSMFHYMRWSFDFLFLTTQAFLAHATLCHLLHWDATKCLPILASYLWMHWVLTLDMLPPLVKARLGIRGRRLAATVLVVQAIGHVLLAREILFQRQWGIGDRVLFRVTFVGEPVEFCGVPFVLSRMVTTFCWCWRLLWRIYVGSENELLVMQGAVEYDDYESHRRHREARERRAAATLSRRSAVSSRSQSNG